MTGPGGAYHLQPDRPLERELRRVALGCIEEALDRLTHLDGAGPDDIETAVHEVRKRAKETRGLLRLARPALGDGYAPLNAGVRDAARELSSIRDAHSLLGAIEDLRGVLGDDDASAIEPIRAHQEAVSAAVSAGLSDDDPRIARAVARLQQVRELVDRWRLPADPTTLEHGVRRTYSRGRKASEKARERPDDHRVHEWRKRVKDLWYQVRLLEPADPEDLGSLVDDLDDLSDLLGDDHDLAVLVAKLESDERGVPERVARRGVALARRRQDELRSEAFALGRHTYADEPGPFAADLARRWRAAVPDDRIERARHSTVDR